jgi:hypothetical protein
MVKTDKSIETGTSITEKAAAIDCEEVEGTAVSPSIEASETKPKDAVLEKGLDIEIESQIETTVDAADKIGEAATSELGEHKNEEATSKEEASVANVVSEEMGAPLDDEISADTVTTARQGLEQPSASIAEDDLVEVKEMLERPIEETSLAASMSPGADSALETEGEDGESVGTRPIGPDITADEITTLEVNTNTEDVDESSLIEDYAIPVADVEDDAVATGPTEIQKDEKDSTLTGPIQTQVMVEAPLISLEKKVDDSESESAAKQSDFVEAAVISSATGLIENNENPCSAVAKAPEAQSLVLQDIASEHALAETEIKNESSEGEFTSVVAEEVPLADLETEDGDGSQSEGQETLGKDSYGVPMRSDDIEDTTQGVKDLKSQRSFVQDYLTKCSDHEFIEEVSGSSEANPLEGIIDVPIDEDSVSGVPHGGIDCESETLTKAEADPLYTPVAACVPIADEEDSDSDYEEEASGFEVAEYDYEEDESMLELDSSAESDSEDESDDDKSASAAEDDDDDDLIFELKNVTATTRVLIPEDQRQNKHVPAPTRWGGGIRLGRTNTSNSNLSFSGQEEFVAKLDPKSVLRGRPLSGSPTKADSADKKEDPTKTIGTLMKKFSGTDTENQVCVSSKLTATVPPAVTIKEVPKRKPLTDIEKARMFAASILLETEEKAIPKAVPKSGFSWLKH